jgi:hypothetical protein
LSVLLPVDFSHFDFFSRTTGPILTKLAHKSFFGGKRFQFAQMKWIPLHQGEILAKELKNTENVLKSSSPEPAGQFQLNLVNIILG